MRHSPARSALAALLVAVWWAAGCRAQAAGPAFRLRYAARSTNHLLCGVDSLYVFLGAAGRTGVSLAELEKELPPGPQGVSVDALAQACGARGLYITAMRTTVDSLQSCAYPMILHVNGTHFITLLGADTDRIVVFDNGIGLFECSPQWFREHYAWDGAALMLGPPSPAMLVSMYGPLLLAVIGTCALALVLGTKLKAARRARQERERAQRAGGGDVGTPLRENCNAFATLMAPSGGGREGVSLVEVVVVVAIIGLLIGLLLPAVQSAREAASRTACASQLKEILLAMHNHHDAHRTFPSNGGNSYKPLPARNGGCFVPTSTYTLGVTSVTYFWAVGDPNLGPAQQTGSWAYAILPYIENEAAFWADSWWEGVPLYICPSRRTAVPQLAMNDAFGIYDGGGWEWAHIDYGANARAIRGSPYLTSISAITDGTSQTILIGEEALSPLLYSSGSWFYNEPFFCGNAPGNRRFGNRIVHDAPDLSFVDNWGSAHPGGANIGFCDGSVHVLSYDMSAAIVSALLTPSSGDLVDGF